MEFGTFDYIDNLEIKFASDTDLLLDCLIFSAPDDSSNKFLSYLNHSEESSGSLTLSDSDPHGSEYGWGYLV